MPFERVKSESFFTKLSHILQDDMSLLHQAVRRKCRPMVELLLAYVPSSLTKESDVGLETLQRIMQIAVGQLIQARHGWASRLDTFAHCS